MAGKKKVSLGIQVLIGLVAGLIVGSLKCQIGSVFTSRRSGLHPTHSNGHRSTGFSPDRCQCGDHEGCQEFRTLSW